MSEIEVKHVVCPNCGGNKITNEWVKKPSKIRYTETTFAEHAEKLKAEITHPMIFEGTLDFNYFGTKLADYAQLVVQCANCKYTQVFPINPTP